MGEQTVLRNLGKRIKGIRVKRKMTQRELATLCAFEKSSISRIEKGKSNPTVATLYKISRALDTDLRSFFKVDPDA